MSAVALGELNLFQDAAPGDVDAWAATLEPVSFAAGEAMICEGDSSSAFFVLLDGEATVTRQNGPLPETVGTMVPGSIVGELGLLRRRKRAATVVPTSPLTGFRGGEAEFAAMLTIPGVRPRLSKIVAGRLARFAPITAVSLPDGREIGLRAGLPSDRPRLADAIERMSLESRHRRFFTSGVPQHLIDYLVDIDYVDHFAWVALEAPDEGSQAIGSCRYIRSFEHRNQAEVAFGIVDEWQGHGLGGLFIGALAVTASNAGIDTFTASVLSDNRAMRRIFNRGGAHWTHVEPGVVATAVPVAAYLDTFAPATTERLGDVAHEIVWGAGTALT